MMRQKLLLSTYNFKLLFQKSCNSNTDHLIKKSALEISSIRLLYCVQTKLLSDKNFILDYVRNINLEHEQNIPSQYLLCNTSVCDLYLINKTVAKQFVSLIQDDLLKNASHVMEVNSGLGFITETLLDIGVPFIHMYEKDMIFFKSLKKLCTKFPEKVSLTKADLFNLSKLMYTEHNNAHAYDLLKFVQQKQWNEESCMQIIGTLNRSMFLRHLILSAVFRTCFMMYGRSTFYLAIPPSIWNKFTTTNNALGYTQIMFETIFDYHVLGELDRKAFIPWNKYIRKQVQMKTSTLYKGKEKHVKNLSILYVVKIEPKREIPVICFGKEDLIYFWYFIRHYFYKPSVRVIPSLEKLVPGCGIRLIEKDLNVFTQFKDLSIKEVHNLFLQFRTWPEFEGSIFTLNAADVKKSYINYVQAEPEDHDVHNNSEWREPESETYEL
ncbi:mitochondrial transcription factor B2 [Nomia melanderi]|uniref:mitochondrial transcription factor B2 n=1 Tax=Nomia melanderi TaxID=2448451 RepID=UPI0013042115|nr:dimethyladenosine transferase 2, mitochondrial [Nomia melanderi]